MLSSFYASKNTSGQFTDVPHISDKQRKMSAISGKYLWIFVFVFKMSKWFPCTYLPSQFTATIHLYDTLNSNIFCVVNTKPFFLKCFFFFFKNNLFQHYHFFFFLNHCNLLLLPTIGQDFEFSQNDINTWITSKP